MLDFIESTKTSGLDAERIEKAKVKRARSYLEIIEPSRNQDVQVREKQETILEEMPDIKKLSRLLKAALQANSVEFTKSQVRDELIIQGVLFEELVKIENDIFDISSEGKTPRQKTESFSEQEEGKVEISPEDQLIMLFHNPDRFKYQELAHLRNPDLSFVKTDKEGKVLEVIGVGEAKSSYLLDKRCFSQFRHFFGNLNKVADFINNQEDTDAHGIKHFGKDPDKTKIKVTDKENFSQYLIVTSDMKIDTQNPRRFFKSVGDGALTGADTLFFESLIKTGKIKIRKSSFSHQELDLLVKKLSPIIADEITTELLEFKAEQESV